MGIFPKNDFIYPPKVGEKVTVEITGELQRIKNEGDEHNYKDKNKKNLGYYDILPVDGDKQMKINTWRVYFSLKEVNPNIGDVIEIDHVKSGEYKIVKL
jgi:hypothetical protein